MNRLMYRAELDSTWIASDIISQIYLYIYHTFQYPRTYFTDAIHSMQVIGGVYQGGLSNFAIEPHIMPCLSLAQLRVLSKQTTC